MDVYREEIFGPVLSVLRADDVDEAIDADQRQPVRQRHRDLHRPAARRPAGSSASVKVGMIGINVPIPVPMAYYSFGGWKDSLFGDHHIHGPEGVALLHPRQGRHHPLAARRDTRRSPPLPHLVPERSSEPTRSAPDLTARHRARLLGGLVRPTTRTRSPGRQYLDEIAQAGYAWTELGPVRASCRRTRRSCATSSTPAACTLCGGTVFAGLHRGAEALDEAVAACGNEAAAARRRWARSTWCCCPSSTPTCTPASCLESARASTRTQWTNLTTGYERARQDPRRGARRRAGVPPARRHPRRHPGAGGAVPRTTPTRAYVNLCLDTGHISYCDGDNIAIIRRFPERIRYVHLKQVDPAVRDRVRAENLSLAEAVPLGVMVRAAVRRARDAAAARRAGRRCDADLFTVVEQDLYPVEPHIPLPIARPHRGLPRAAAGSARYVAGPTAPPSLKLPRPAAREGTLDDEYPQVVRQLAVARARSACRPWPPAAARAAPRTRPERQRWRRRRPSPAASTTRSR